MSFRCLFSISFHPWLFFIVCFPVIDLYDQAVVCNCNIFFIFLFTTSFVTSFIYSCVAIFLGSFRMPYQEIRRMIVEVDMEQLTEPMIQVGQVLYKAVKMLRAAFTYLTLVHGFLGKITLV